MRKGYLFLWLFVLVWSTGCSSSWSGQEIAVQKKVEGSTDFEDFREVTESKQIERVIALLKEADWQTMKVDMARYADYQLDIQLKNDEGSDTQLVRYLLWVEANGERLELTEGTDQYVKLQGADAKELYELLTGNVNKEREF